MIVLANRMTKSENFKSAWRCQRGQSHVLVNYNVRLGGDNNNYRGKRMKQELWLKASAIAHVNYKANVKDWQD